MHAPTLARRTSALRVWSSARSARRFRRPTDVLLLITALLAAVVLGLFAPGPNAADQALVDLESSVGDVLEWLWSICYALLAGWALIVVILTAASRGRQRLLLDYLLAGALAIGGGLLAYRLAVGSWPAEVGDYATANPRPMYTIAFLTLATSILVTASPHLAHPLRLLGRGVIVVGTVAAVGLGIALPIGAIASLAVGVAAAAATHLLLGTPAGRSTPDQVADALADLGIDAATVEEARVQMPGVSVMDAHSAEGAPLFVKVYGRDAWDGQVVGSVWTAVTRRGERPVLFRSRGARVDHEAVITLIAQRGGVPVVPVVVAGVADDGDALLVTEARGPGLDDMTDVADDYVASIWDAVAALHGLGIAHRDLQPARIVRGTDGGARLCGFDNAEIAADPVSLLADRARVLVASALAVGQTRAVALALDALGHDGVVEVIPFLQPAVMDSGTGRAVKDVEWSLEELRAAAIEATGIDAPPLQQIRRVTVKSVLTVAIIAIVAYTLIAMLAGIDLQTVVQELSSANMLILLGALLISPFVQVGFSIGTMGSTTRKLLYRPVLMLQYSIQFIALTLPATAARIALEVRFFERFGLPASSAVSIGVIDSFSGFLVQIALIILILVSGLPGFTEQVFGTSSSSTSSTSTDSSSSPSLWALLLVLIVLGIVISLVVPRLRARIFGIIPRLKAAALEQSEGAKSALAVVRKPRKVAMMVTGNLIAQVLQAIILGVCLAAFGDTAHLSQLILINTAVSLFAGLMPVPGGMGVAEAGYTVGLQAIGVPSAVAMSTAIAFRLVTFYLPPIWGAFAMRWLRRNAYV